MVAEVEEENGWRVEGADGGLRASGVLVELFNS
jgi:hypothetical protein